MEKDGGYHRVDQGYVARQFKVPFYTGLKGLCCVCSPATVRTGQLFGDNVGLFNTDDAVSTLEVRNASELLLAETIYSNSRLSTGTS